MRFLTLSPVAMLALLLAVLALVLGAHLLKPARQRRPVPSFLLWARVLGRQARARGRWRWWLSLLLAACIAALLTLALGRPEAGALGGRSERVVLVLDNSPSMAARTRDGSSRFEHAVARARALIAQLAGASEVLVVDTMGQAPLAGFLTPEQAWRSVGDLAVVSAGRAALPPLALTDGAVAVHWFTDGVALSAAPRGVKVHGVFEPADNVGITAFEASPPPADPTRVRALLQLTNGSARAVRARWSVQGPGFSLTGEKALAPGETRAQTLDLSVGAPGVYRARLQSSRDALPIDDEAYTVVPDHAPRRVLLVSARRGRLMDSLRALPGVVLTVARPGAAPGGGRFDATVFDGHAPARLPGGGALLFGAATGGSRPVADAAVSDWDGRHPIAQGIAWGDLRLRNATLAQSGEHAVVRAAALTGGAAGAVVSAGGGTARWVRVGFVPEDSNFTLQPGFPVFLGNVLAWIAQRPQPLTRHLGDITVPLVDARVRDARGAAVLTHGEPGGTRFRAAAPGAYTARQGATEVPVVANVTDPAYSLINASWLPPGALAAQARNGRAYVARSELWTLLLLSAALLVLLEWAAFTRKVTR